MRRILPMLLMLMSLPALANQSFSGFCTPGAQTVTTSGLSSTTKALGVPLNGGSASCTVTVYLHGTVSLATIYSDNNATPTPLANPFTATSAGAWSFYAANGRYDVVLSGTGFASPFTINDVLYNDPNISMYQYVASYWCSTPGTLDQTCIQNAVNAINASGVNSGTVYIPPGVYTINSPIVNSGVGIEFLGSRIGGVYGTELIAATSNTDILQSTSPALKVRDVRFQGQCLSPACTGTGNGIVAGSAVTETFDTQISECWFTQIPNADLLVNNLSGLILTNNFFETSNYGLYSSPAAGAAETRDLQVVGNRFYATYHNPIYLAGAGGALNGQGSWYANITGNIFDFCGTTPSTDDRACIHLTTGADYVTITGNHFNNSRYDDVRIDNSQSVSVSGNTSARTGRSVVYCVDCQSVAVNGNSAGSTNYLSYGGTTGSFYFARGAGVASQYNTISGNSVLAWAGENRATYDLYTDAGTTGTTIGLNNWHGFASAQMSIGDTTAFILDNSLVRVPVNPTFGPNVATVSTSNPNRLYQAGSNPYVIAGDGNGLNDKETYIHTDTTSNYGELQAFFQGTGPLPLVLNRIGGNIIFGSRTGTVGVGAIAQDSGALKHIRFNNGGLGNLGGTCPTAAGVGATCTSAAITWTTAFADANYTLVCTLTSPTNVPTIAYYTKTGGTSFTITIAALTAAAANAGEVDCVGIYGTTP